jgi:electron transfer flavoprotein alpha subunit
MAGVWIFAENQEQSLELLNIGTDLAAQLETKLVSLLYYNHEMAQDHINHGADEVLLLPPLKGDQLLDAYIPTIISEAQKEEPDIFLLAGTIRGKEIAARIASGLETGLCSECIGLSLDQETGLVEMDRLVYGGAGVQKVVCSKRPQMATIPARTFEAVAEQGARQGQIRELLTPPQAPVKILERRPKDRKSQDIREARVVIGVGRGIEKQEDMVLAQQLAEVLGGEIGCTRPISEEMHWLSEDLCIGLSGISVKPELYIGVGISGQIQHVTGIRDAKVICAVNSDENAPIFEVADYGIVGNLYEVVPQLIKELKK